MYLHELGDEEASFTKEEMQSGKHQDYEQKLVDTYLTPSVAPAVTPAALTTQVSHTARPVGVGDGANVTTSTTTTHRNGSSSQR